MSIQDLACILSVPVLLLKCYELSAIVYGTNDMQSSAKRFVTCHATFRAKWSAGTRNKGIGPLPELGLLAPYHVTWQCRAKSIVRIIRMSVYKN